MARKTELVAQGVDPRVASRTRHPLVKHEGRFCRDRLPWGGFNWEDACDCKGQCQHDTEERKDAEVRDIR